MLILSARWPTWLCMVTILLGWVTPLIAARDIQTSEVYKVLTDEDDVGGSCSARMPQVDALIPEVSELVKAAIDSIDKILSDPIALKAWPKSKKLNRMRLLLLARWFIGTEFDEATLKVREKDQETGNDFKKNLKDFKEAFGKVKTEIAKKNQDFRFSCDDTWVKRVDKLQTDFGKIKKGTPIKDITALSGASKKEWIWFDRGGPAIRPAKDENDETQQRSWYMSDGSWPEDGPCAKNIVNGKEVIPFASTSPFPLKMITFCPFCWDQVGQKLKKDIRELKKADIATDGSEYMDSYRSPGMILLHEMTHQIFKTDDFRPAALGYGFANIIDGKDDPDAAINNADTYPFFAMAAYLDQVEWHTGKAQKIGTKEES